MVERQLTLAVIDNEFKCAGGMWGTRILYSVQCTVLYSINCERSESCETVYVTVVIT